MAMDGFARFNVNLGFMGDRHRLPSFPARIVDDLGGGRVKQWRFASYCDPAAIWAMINDD
jgi:hypothetical protein